MNYFRFLLVGHLFAGVTGDGVDLRADRAVVEATRLEAVATAATAQAAADALLTQQEKERIAAIKRAREKTAAAATLQRTQEEAELLNPYSNKRDSYKWHVANQFFIKPKAASRFCMTLPAADTAYGFRNGMRRVPSFCGRFVRVNYSFVQNDVCPFRCRFVPGLAVILARCNASDTTQLFSYDPVSKYIHPGYHLATTCRACLLHCLRSCSSCTVFFALSLSFPRGQHKVLPRL